MKVIVIIPTYNENKSIGPLIEALESEFLRIGNHQMGILIVDGNSPDGTADIVKEKIALYKNINLIVEKEKRGLGIAYIHGMKYAVSELGAGAIVEFDGDGQHDPKDIKRLVAELDNGYDYVIGSRYVIGGKVPKDWGWHRKILSRFGSLIVRYGLWLPTHDNTSGLKLSRIEGFAGRLPLDENKILSKRHAYKIHLLYTMVKNGAKVKEIPIKFLSREAGDSKSTLEDILESLKVIFLLWIKK